MPAGHPPKFKNAEELQAKIDEYFEKGITIRRVLVGPRDNKVAVDIPVPTITGLVLYIGFADRHSFYDYEKRPEFSHTTKRARTRIEKHYEELLQSGLGAGSIFALKNFGWIDSPLIDLSEHIHITYNYRMKKANDSRLSNKPIRDSRGRLSKLSESNPG